MSFLAPFAFWFALALPVVVVFYLLKRKRQVKLISSTVLWQKFLAETQANAVLAEPFPIRGGDVHIPDRPGCGIEWDEDAVRRYAA